MLILSLNLRKYILTINKKINLIINIESSCLLGQKIVPKGERERENHINLSTPMNLYNMYIIPIQVHMHLMQLKK